MHVPSLLNPQYLPNTIGGKSKFLNMTNKIVQTLAPACFFEFTWCMYPNSLWLPLAFISVPVK